PALPDSLCRSSSPPISAFDRPRIRALRQNMFKIIFPWAGERRWYPAAVTHREIGHTTMDIILKQGRLLFAIAIMVFGVLNVICAHFQQAMLPVIPWVPGNQFLAYFTGVALLMAGLSIAANFRTRLAAILLGMLFLLCVLLLQIARVAALPLDVGVRTCAFETLAMCGAAFSLAGTLPAEGRYSRVVDSAVRWLM